MIKNSVIVRQSHSMEESQLGDNDQVQVEEDGVARQPLSQPWCTVHPSHFIHCSIVALDDIVWLSCPATMGNQMRADKIKSQVMHSIPPS